MSIFEQVAGEKIGSLLSNKTLGGIVGGGIGTIGMGMLKSRLPPGLGPKLSVVNNVAGRLLNGDLKGAALGALNSGIFTAKFPWLDNLAATAGFMAEPNRAMGGVTPVEAKRIMKGSLETNFARKNLFLVRISKMPEGIEWLNADAPGARLQMFNLFVTDVSYSGFSIAADQQRVGSISMDQPNGRDPIELRITTMDNEAGDIKFRFNMLANRVANTDGTMGVPSEYLVKIKILHSFIHEESEKHWLKDLGWSQFGWFRPVSIEHDLSRKDDALEEMTLVFHQFDPYYR